MKTKPILCLALVLSGLHGHNSKAAIVFPKAPDEGRQIAYEKVSRVIQGFTNAFKGLKIEELTITDAHKMYSVGPQDVVSGNLLSVAKFAGWRYLVVHGTNAVGEVPLIVSPKDGKLLKAGGVFGDRLAQPTLMALQKVEELPQIKQQDYEPRYLSMPMSFSAVWLHGKTNDIVIPLPPTWGKWNAYQPYSEDEITKLLKPVAEDELRHSGDIQPTFKGPIPYEKFDPFERKTNP